jgi:DNA polymerase
VPGEGDNPQAFIIGEAPGAQEDIAGRPFVGAAGAVLRQLMQIADLQSGVLPDGTHGAGRWAGNCWLTNVLKFRPPGNRNPTDTEIKAFRPLLMDEWEAVGAPSLIIPVGSVALRAVTGKPMSILRTAGKHHSYLSAKTGKQLHIWPMVHPAFGLRTPDVQPMLEADWENLGRWRAAHS